MGRKVDAIAMDDAGNGQHGVCATPSPRLVERVRDHYGLDTIHGTRDLGGASHLNLLIVTGLAATSRASTGRMSARRGWMPCRWSGAYSRWVGSLAPRWFRPATVRRGP